MRPATNFTLHALAAAMLAAFAATSAAAGDAYLKLGEIKGEAAKDKKTGDDWIEIQSWQWGEVAKIDGFTIKQGVKPVGTSDMTMKRGTGPAEAPTAGGVQVAVGDVTGDGTVGASESMTVGGSQTESGLPTGKRQHKPMAVTKPLDRGSVTVKASLPGCAVGKAYPTAALQTAAARYELKEVIISGCTMESISLNYGQIKYTPIPASKQDPKVQVRGWDPEKKEQ